MDGNALNVIKNEMPIEEQKKLYDIISEVFKEELKTINCFVLPLVGQRAGKLMNENGFEKANKATFLATPAYFNVGYNEKNASAISLVGFLDDPNFSQTKREMQDHPKQIARTEMTNENQRRLAEIFVRKFSGHNNSGTVYLSSIGKWAGKEISQAGFGKASLDLFKSASDYFECTEEANGTWLVYLKEGCGLSLSQSKSKNGKRVSGTSKQAKAKSFEEFVYEKLKSKFKTNEVSVNDILHYLDEKKIVFPSDCPSVDELVNRLGEKYGSVVRNNGEGTTVEKYIVLRKPLPIPSSVRERIEKIVFTHFIDKDLVPNSDIGVAIKNNGIDYKDYKYADLTAFLRAFPEVFNIVAIPKGNNRFNIFVRILSSFKERFSEYESKKTEELQNETLDFEKIVSDLFCEGKYDSIINSSMLREVIKHSNGDMWNCVIKSYQIVNGVPIEKTVDFSNWELVAFDFDYLQKNNTSEYLANYFQRSDEIDLISQYITDYSHKTVNYSTLAQRIHFLCRNDTIYEILLNLGLIARVTSDKAFCFRLLILHYANCDEGLLKKLWYEFAEDCINKSSMLMIVGTWFTQGKLEYIVEFSNLYYEMGKEFDVINLYVSYSKALLGISIELPELKSLDNRRSVGLVKAFLSQAESLNLVDLYISMVYRCFAEPTRYVPISSLVETINEHSDFLNNNYEYLLHKIEHKKDKDTIVVVNLLVSFNIINYDDRWEKLYYSINQEYKTIINQCNSDERERVLYEAIMLFPSDQFFINEYISMIHNFDGNDEDELESFIDNLINCGNYTQVIMLYEHDPFFQLTDKIWFLRKLSICYRYQQEFKKSLEIEIAIIKLLLSNNAGDINESLISLVSVLYDGFISHSFVSLDKSNALLIIQLFNHFKCEANIAHQYCISMMGLALCTQNIPLLSLLYCLIEGKEAENKFLEICEDEIRESDLGYSFRIGELQKTYEYLITHEKPDDIFMILGKAANVARQHQDESIYAKNKGNYLETVDPQNVIIVLISEYNKERSWKLLSQFSNKTKKYTVNVVANHVWLYKFKDITYPLTNCARSLERTVDEGLPSNFLWWGLEVWKTDFKNTVEVYQKAFIQHITKYNSFKKADDSLVDAFYNMLVSKKKPIKCEVSLAIEIAKQSKSFGLFFERFINNRGLYSKLLQKDIGGFVAFSSAFICCADETTYQLALSTIRELRIAISSNNLSPSDRSAIMWIDELMINNRELNGDTSFLRASMELLSSYPDYPSADVISKWITKDSTKKLPDYSLIRNWVNTYGSFRTVVSADTTVRNYLYKHSLPDDVEERVEVYKIRLFLAEKYIIYYNRDFPPVNDDFLRRCKSYYCLRILTNNDSEIPEDLKNKMHKDLLQENKFDEYLAYEEGVNQFYASVNDMYIREFFLYCGIINYWDSCLDNCLEKRKEIIENIDAIKAYFPVIDYRTIRRRLIQMYVYSFAANMIINNSEIDLGEVSLIKDVRYFYNHINNDLIIDQYHESLFGLIEILEPSLIQIVSELRESKNEDETVKMIKGINFALTNKNLDVLHAKLDSVFIERIDTYVLQTVAAIQYKQDIYNMLLQMALSGEEYSFDLLRNPSIQSVLGNYVCDLLLGIFYVSKGDYQKANDYYLLLNTRSEEYGILYDSLQNSIANQKPIEEKNKLFSSDIVNRRLPKFSYMKHSDASGADLLQLINDFYSTNLYDPKGKCLIASRVFSLINDGKEYSDTIKFIFDWGFVEIEATHDIERKAQILFEMLEGIDLLKGSKAFKERFVQSFLYLLQELDFSLIFKNFNRIFSCHKILYNRFQPYENSDCYAIAVVLLRNLYDLGKENVDPNVAIDEIDLIKSKVIDLHIQYPQNRFVNKCIDYVDRFAQQILERGIFEVRVLNTNKEYSGVIYYQVRNIGFELISDITLTFEIEGYKKTIEQVKISSVLPEGLRPNQVYAGEYSPNELFDEGISIGCSIIVEYSSLDNNGNLSYKNYIAVNPNTSGQLQVVKNQAKAYKKGAGYIEGPIKRSAFFVGREGKLNQIIGKAINGQNVLLFGTNGTGKSSILYRIRNERLRTEYQSGNERYKDILGKDFYVAELKFDVDCTEQNVLESIIASISKATLFKSFIRRNGNDETKDILQMAEEEWLKNIDKAFNSNGECENSDSVRQYLSTLDEALSISDLDLYILIDQFERIVSSKNVNSKHMLFLRDMSCQRIRFIIAGSNYLLEEVAVDKIKKNKDNLWSDIFSRNFEKEKIGNMDYEDFKLLINQKSVLNEGELQYTQEAVDYLWQFTKGHAFYSCLLGNRTLDIMSNRQVKRDRIYPSDIFIAIYQTGKYMPSEISNQEKETAIKEQIFQDISDNVPIKYIGKSIAKMQSLGARRVSYPRLRDYIEESRPDVMDEFDNSLSILVARDFLSFDEMEIPKDSMDAKHSIEAKETREYFFTSDLYLEHFASVYVPELSDKDREAIESKNRSIDELIADLKTRKYTAQDIGKIRNEVREIVGDGGTQVVNIERQYNDRSVDQSVGNQYNMQIQAQTINSFSTLLSSNDPLEFAKAFTNLPNIKEYLGDDHDKVLQLQQEISREEKKLENSDSFTDNESSQLIEAKYKEIEEIVLPAEERKVKDIIAAISLDDFVNVSDEMWQELLGVSKDVIGRLKSLPTQYSTPLGFAVIIHSVFSRIYESSLKNKEVDADELDFCPVAILYCKIVEAMLKEEHTPIYSECFANELVDSRKQDSPLFSEVDKNSNLLTIGTYLYYLTTVNVNRIFDRKTYSRLPLKRFWKRSEISDLSTYTSKSKDDWYEHADNLPVVVSTRNKSAHDLQPISKERFDWLIEVLFKQGELLRIWELSR